MALVPTLSLRLRTAPVTTAEPPIRRAVPFAQLPAVRNMHANLVNEDERTVAPAVAAHTHRGLYCRRRNPAGGAVYRS